MKILTITWKWNSESYWNVKSREKAQAIVDRKDKDKIIVAKYGEAILFPVPKK